MFVLATLIFGAIALHELSVNPLPSVETPELLVRTEWNGASAHEVDHTINEPLEAYLSTVPGIHSIHSIAKQGLSLISLRFAWHSNMDLAFLNTREKLDQVFLGSLLCSHWLEFSNFLGGGNLILPGYISKVNIKTDRQVVVETM